MKYLGTHQLRLFLIRNISKCGRNDCQRTMVKRVKQGHDGTEATTVLRKFRVK